VRSRLARPPYNVERLIAERGADAKLPDLLAAFANREKARSVSIHDRCRARYERLRVVNNPGAGLPVEARRCPATAR
jgi:hypothetical protein